jgi:hypothetical protein
MTAKKKLGARATRRQADRDVQKLMRDRTRLAALEKGGAPDRPIQVMSASEVEIAARATPCIQCAGIVRVDEHVAETIGAERLRVAHVSCPACGTKRALYYRIGPSLPN